MKITKIYILIFYQNINMGNFLNWFKNKLKTSSYPEPDRILNYSYVINVSDEYKSEIYDVCLNQNIKYFWFPLNECTDNIGINSIYGALQILYIAEKENKNVLVFCHAGSNRSVTVSECYFYMRTKTYPIRKPRNKKLSDDIESMFTFDDEKDKTEYRRLTNNSRLQNNIEMGHLPAKFKTEDFLKECEKHFQKNTSLDSIKLKTHLTSY